jgi:hypothetical protein
MAKMAGSGEAWRVKKTELASQNRYAELLYD